MGQPQGCPPAGVAGAAGHVPRRRGWLALPVRMEVGTLILGATVGL